MRGREEDIGISGGVWRTIGIGNCLVILVFRLVEYLLANLGLWFCFLMNTVVQSVIQ